MRRFSVLFIACVGSFGLLLSPAASARELEYTPARGCPSRADVIGKLESDAPDGRNARIDIQAANGGYRGKVTVGDANHQVVRAIEARTCGAVVQALALVVALDHEESDST